jgi:hypothetical protein
MQRGSSRLNASIFLISSSSLFTNSSSLAALSDTFPIMETSLRKSQIVLGTNVGLKSKLNSGGTEPISNLSLPIILPTLLSLCNKYLSTPEKNTEKHSGSANIYIHLLYSGRQEREKKNGVMGKEKKIKNRS